MQENNVIPFRRKKPSIPDEGSIVFTRSEVQILMKFDPNGDIYVNGSLIENDKEVVNALREFLLDAGHNYEDV